MTSLADLIRTATAQLAASGVDNSGLDARLLIAHALKCDRVQLTVDARREITESENSAAQELIERRTKREPVARILGLREFWGLPFGLNEATLDPRPDTETLVEAALKNAKKTPEHILDLGTGTGCLLLALLNEYPSAAGLGIDIAPRAVEQAAINAKRLELDTRARFMVNDWLDHLDEKFDLIVSNPPYIAKADIPSLMPEVRDYAPHAALDGGTDGLDPYRLLIPLLPRFLRPEGLALFEVGQGQAPEVCALFKAAGLDSISVHNDLGGIERCVAGYLLP